MARPNRRFRVTPLPARRQLLNSGRSRKAAPSSSLAASGPEQSGHFSRRHAGRRRAPSTRSRRARQLAGGPDQRDPGREIGQHPADAGETGESAGETARRRRRAGRRSARNAYWHPRAATSHAGNVRSGNPSPAGRGCARDWSNGRRRTAKIGRECEPLRSWLDRDRGAGAAARTRMPTRRARRWRGSSPQKCEQGQACLQSVNIRVSAAI